MELLNLTYCKKAEHINFECHASKARNDKARRFGQSNNQVIWIEEVNNMASTSIYETNWLAKFVKVTKDDS